MCVSLASLSLYNFKIRMDDDSQSGSFHEQFEEQE